jgi:hypothetical protein
MKVVYIAHPISGDVKGNISKIIEIVRKINIEHPNIVPFVPYLADCLAMRDNIPEERERGIENARILFERRFIDEIWLYGDRLSNGMVNEIILGISLGIRIVPQTPQTHRALYKPFNLKPVNINQNEAK